MFETPPPNLTPRYATGENASNRNFLDSRPDRTHLLCTNATLLQMSAGAGYLEFLQYKTEWQLAIRDS